VFEVGMEEPELVLELFEVDVEELDVIGSEMGGVGVEED
jgi:hypothetical protein